MKKLLFVVAFVSSASFGAACKNELKDACEYYVEIRNGCEAFSPPDEDEIPKYTVDMCTNIDPECQEFFECAVTAPCNKDKRDKYRLDLESLNKDLAEIAENDETEFVECKEPENKACTDADLRP